MNKKLEENIKFYLDPLEFLNKPRRVFMGLEYLLEKKKDEVESTEELELIKEIIREAQSDFYKITLPKFEKKINKLYE